MINWVAVKSASQLLFKYKANVTVAITLCPNPKPNPNPYSNPCHNPSPTSDLNPNLKLNELACRRVDCHLVDR